MKYLLQGEAAVIFKSCWVLPQLKVMSCIIHNYILTFKVQPPQHDCAHHLVFVAYQRLISATLLLIHCSSQEYIFEELNLFEFKVLKKFDNLGTCHGLYCFWRIRLTTKALSFMTWLVHPEWDVMLILLYMRQLSSLNGIVGISKGPCGMG